MMHFRVLILAIFLLHSAQVAGAQDLLWSAGMERGNLGEWTANDCGGEFNSGVSNTEASNEVAKSGGWSAKMAITTPSVPTSGTRLFRWCEPQQHRDLYYSTWYYLPRQYNVQNFWNVLQWKSKTSSRNDPFFVLNIGNRPDGSMFFYLYDWQSRRSHGQSSANVPVGRWFQIEAYYQCRADNTGRVMIWQDGVLLFDVTDVRTRYGDGDCQWSIDNYSDGLSPSNAVLFVDDAAIGLNRIGLGPVEAPPAAPAPEPAPAPKSEPGKKFRCRG